MGTHNKKLQEFGVWYNIHSSNQISVDGKIKTNFTFEAEYSSDENMFLASSTTFVVVYTSPIFVSLIVLD